MNYSFRYKERKPEETVSLCKKILEDLGISVKETVYKTGEYLYGVDIDSIFGNFSTHGKGTTKEYALASGYAEFLERLQNIYFSFPFSEDSSEFRYFKDEKVVGSPKALVENEDLQKDLTDIFISSTRRTPNNILDYLSFWTSQKEHEEISLLPFYSVVDRDIKYLPMEILNDVQFTTGECAGNTPEEALTQGLSEIFERWTEYFVNLNELTPPEIPREYLQERCKKQFLMIQEIEKLHKDYKVSVYDYSLGQGVPVVAVLLTDTSKGSYVLQFGAFPRIEVALERCLTELIQGFDFSSDIQCVRHFRSFNFENSENWFTFDNCLSRVEFSIGDVPASFFKAIPSWQFEDWSITEDFSYRKAFNYLIQKCLEFSSNVYIRDTGFLGFPTYSIYVPGLSILSFPRMQMIDTDLETKSREFLRYLPSTYFDLDSREKQLLSSFLSQHPDAFIDYEDNCKEPETLIRIALFLKGEDYTNALKYLETIVSLDPKYKALKLEIQMSLLNYSVQDRDSFLLKLFGEKSLLYIRNYWREDIVEKVLILFNPDLTSWTVEDSNFSKEEELLIEDLQKRIQEKIKAYDFNQQKLGELIDYVE